MSHAAAAGAPSPTIVVHLVRRLPGDDDGIRNLREADRSTVTLKWLQGSTEERYRIARGAYVLKYRDAASALITIDSDSATRSYLLTAWERTS